MVDPMCRSSSWGFCDELQEIGNETKASVTHTKDFFGEKKKWLKVILRTKISEINRF
jgi:hypothetical protein